MPELALSRRYSADPAEVWSAWTDPERLAAWFWPPRFATAVSNDVRPGGRWRISSQPVGIAASGVYTVVDDPSRLEFTFLWDGEVTETSVALTLSDGPEGTELVLRHIGLATDQDAAEHTTGWNDCLSRLADHVDTPTTSTTSTGSVRRFHRKLADASLSRSNGQLAAERPTRGGTANSRSNGRAGRGCAGVARPCVSPR